MPVWVSSIKIYEVLLKINAKLKSWLILLSITKFINGLCIVVKKIEYDQSMKIRVLDKTVCKLFKSKNSIFPDVLDL